MQCSTIVITEISCCWKTRSRTFRGCIEKAGNPCATLGSRSLYCRHQDLRQANVLWLRQVYLTDPPDPSAPVRSAERRWNRTRHDILWLLCSCRGNTVVTSLSWRFLVYRPNSPWRAEVALKSMRHIPEIVRWRLRLSDFKIYVFHSTRSTHQTNDPMTRPSAGKTVRTKLDNSIPVIKIKQTYLKPKVRKENTQCDWTTKNRLNKNQTGTALNCSRSQTISMKSISTSDNYVNSSRCSPLILSVSKPSYPSRNETELLLKITTGDQCVSSQ